MFSIDKSSAENLLLKLVQAGIVDTEALTNSLLEQKKTESLLAEILSELKLQTEILQEISL